MIQEELDTMFPLTSICRSDMLSIGFTQEQVEQLTDMDMRRIASKMSDAYLDQSYWSDMQIFTESVLERA